MNQGSLQNFKKRIFKIEVKLSYRHWFYCNRIYFIFVNYWLDLSSVSVPPQKKKYKLINYDNWQ